MTMGSVLPFLCEGIISNILKRLPVKSLIRFQCVSKDWQDLIKNPFFIQEHLHHSTQRNPSLLVEQSHRHYPLYPLLLDFEMQLWEVVEIPTLFNYVGDISIVGSCNGLLCVADSSVILLWNPATREVRQVPITLEHIPITCSFGFGFSPTINDYKIVMIKLLALGYVVEVYSLSTGSWRTVQFDYIKDIIVHCGHGVAVNGVMFWKGSRQGDDSDDSNEVIISFDMASEVFTVIPWPVLSGNPTLKLELAAYEDKLAVISHPGVINNENSFIYFGVMEEGVIGSSEGKWNLWRKLVHDFHQLDLRAVTIWRNQIVCIDSELPSYICETDDEDEKGNDDELLVGVYLMSITDNQRELTGIPKRPGYYVRVFNYVESLVSVGNIQTEEI